MTTFGSDISNYQAGAPLRKMKAQGYAFLMILCTQGAGFASPSYAAQMRHAKRWGYLAVAYHFLEHGNVAAQVDNLARHIGDLDIRVMLDCEPYGSSRPTLHDCREFRRLAKAKGIRVTMLYMPGWYHRELGCPNLRGWSLVQSAYLSSAHEYGSQLYPGDNHPNWAAYGGVAPSLLQFASTGKVDGYGGNLDLDAFKGTRAELAATGHFTDHAKPKAPKKPKRRTRGKAADAVIADARKIHGGPVRTRVKAAILRAARKMPFIPTKKK